MPKTPRILAFSGSLRKGSLNHKLVEIAAAGARENGAEVTLIRLRDFPLPVFDGDFEDGHGMPEEARRLKKLFAEHDGLLIASPEYNSGNSAALKNAIDWVSRAETDDEPPLTGFRGKGAVIMSASPGGLGGIRGLVHLRSILGNIGVTVLPDQLSVSSAHEAFDEAGALKDARQLASAKKLGANLAQFLKKQLA